MRCIINSWESWFSFLNRSIPYFPQEQIILNPKEQRLIKIETSFIDGISGLAIAKMLDSKAQNTMKLKLKFVQNLATLDVTNSSFETIIFDPKEMSGILDLWLIGYYKIRQGILQQNLSKYYRLESADIQCEQFNKFVNTLKKERMEETQKKYPWLVQDVERRSMSDKEILDKYVDLGNSCLIDSEKIQVMAMIYRYNSLRDEIGTCTNIEIEIDITDKSPFFIRPYHVKEEDRNISDKEMKKLCYLGIWKEGFSAYSSPVMLISRKVTKDKRFVTDFRHLNVRIAKNNLAYPLSKVTFSVLGSSRYEVFQY